ncbi:MAG: hypothetical protein H6865_05335 [Rhodospirillales bacterium]|nr:hypothetical protein [Planctomycetales bacterium]MCB1537980.1 hypothetical protein [Alphaproteobacteria bacterium]MCB9987042.1 hypothetical protein [Rhodospirillales bacterium]USO08189.1 MAG: hypothetical protein H6866_02955 [Rhodospirillales bacterium]
MPRRKKDGVLDDVTRAKIAACLPQAIGHALDSYRDFAQPGQIVDVKTFAAHHAACKAAVAHIELLLRLAASVEMPAADDDGLATLITDAEGELLRYRAQEDDEDGA